MTIACQETDKTEGSTETTEENSATDDTTPVETKQGTCNSGYCYWSCSTDSDCPNNQSTCASNGYCVQSCSADSDCYGDDTCSAGYCLTSCSGDADCELE